MKTVLFAAAGSLFLAFAAHAAEAPNLGGSQETLSNHAAPQPTLPPVSASGATCIGGASVTPTAYSTDADAESDTSPCSQYLSTQTLVQPPSGGRT